MTRQIMVPVDGSLFSEQALPCAYEIGCRTGATLHVVKVHAPPPTEARVGDATFIGGEQLDEAAREEERAYLARLAEAARCQTGAELITALLQGEVVAALDRYAITTGISLIIMTTHGRGGLSRAWLGSVADAMVRSVNVPVLLLRPRHGESMTDAGPFALHHILIPLDGSELSARMMGPALDLGRLLNARLTLTRVIALPSSAQVPNSFIPPADSAAADAARREAANELERVAEPLRSAGYVVNTVVTLQQQPALGIIELAPALSADLIAMATHGRTGLKRLALGSVSDRVMRGSTVPLLLWRPPADGNAATHPSARSHSAERVVEDRASIVPATKGEP